RCHLASPGYGALAAVIDSSKVTATRRPARPVGAHDAAASVSRRVSLHGRVILLTRIGLLAGGISRRRWGRGLAIDAHQQPVAPFVPNVVAGGRACAAVACITVQRMAVVGDVA